MASPEDQSERGGQSKEYYGQRDMDRFWETFDFEKEPLKQPWYVPLVGFLVVSK